LQSDIELKYYIDNYVTIGGSKFWYYLVIDMFFRWFREMLHYINAACSMKPYIL